MTGRLIVTQGYIMFIWVILWQLFKIQSFVYMKGKFVTNVSFATIRLINHSWEGIKCLASCFIKNIFFLPLLFPWGGNICLYLHNTFKCTFSYFFFNINHKTDMNINEWIVLLIYVELLRYFFLYLRSIEKVCVS